MLPKDDEAADELKEFAYSATLSVKTLHLYFTPVCLDCGSVLLLVLTCSSVR